MSNIPNFEGPNESEIQQVNAINQAKAFWIQAKCEKEYADRIEKLTYLDYVNTIRSLPSMWEYRNQHIKDAQSEVDKKKKKERQNISYIEYAVKKDFFGDEENIKIDKIIQSGLETYGWNLYFTLYGVRYYIQIPIRSNLTSDNLEWANYGMFEFVEEEQPSCWTVRCSDYTEEGLAKKIKEYLHPEENK